MTNMWDERYAQEGYAYGEEPNAFFKTCLDRVPQTGRLLLPAEGEGRNAVYAARRGWRVDAFDISAVGRQKAMQLAARHGVSIRYQVASFGKASIEPRSYDMVALIYAHMHEVGRRSIHRKLAEALAPRGRLILEAYSKEQLGYGTGGPPDERLLYAVEDLREDFSELDITQLEKVDAEIREGRYHTGLASVVRLVAAKS